MNFYILNPLYYVCIILISLWIAKNAIIPADGIGGHNEDARKRAYTGRSRWGGERLKVKSEKWEVKSGKWVGAVDNFTDIFFSTGESVIG